MSIPYVYPACPLNIDHAKLFVIADVFVRHQRNKGRKVIFPVAAHYSGVAAHNLTKSFTDIYQKNYKDLTEVERNLQRLYIGYYKTPEYILKSFVKPEDILNYFSQEILWELKSLGVSCDYENYYATNLEDYSLFVREVLEQYRKKDVLIENAKGELALNYDSSTWQAETIAQINKTFFQQAFHKNNILAATSNIRNDWGLLREAGMGVQYQEKWVIDPMFDSELFTLFDLYIHHVHGHKLSQPAKQRLFKELITSLASKSHSKNPIIRNILDDLPCDLFIGEEHLKNWVVKKIYTETLLYDRKYRTKKYFITGMGLLDGERMSASKGHAILAKDLIKEHNGDIARLVILLCGGHPSKGYTYDPSLPGQAKKMIHDFIPYYQYILTFDSKNRKIRQKSELHKKLSGKIEKNLQEGYLKQGVIDLLVTIPKEYRNPTNDEAIVLREFFSSYLSIFLPDFAKTFMC